MVIFILEGRPAGARTCRRAEAAKKSASRVDVPDGVAALTGRAGGAAVYGASDSCPPQRSAMRLRRAG